MKSITATLDNKYSHSQQFDKTYNVMDHIDSSRSVEYQAVGSNIYTSKSGARIVKFRLSDDRAWLDPSSVKIQYKITNNGVGTENLYPIKSHGFFTRLRIMSRGSLIEDIGEYNRVHEMFQNLKPDNEAKSDYLGGFKNSPDLTFPAPATDAILDYFTKILPSEDMVVSFQPLSGLLNQGHYIPLSFLPIEIELELSTDPTANIIKKDSMTRAEDKPKVSEEWAISEFKILCDQKYYSPMYTDIFVNQITQENGSYKIPINHYTSIYQTLQDTGPIDINISKSVHSLDRVYVSFFRPLYDTRAVAKIAQSVYLKEYNFFYSTAMFSDSLRYNGKNDIKRLGLRIGSLQFPDMPLNSNSLCYYYLNKCHPETSMDIYDYHTTKFISVFNLERAGADSNVLARGIDTNNKNLSLTIEWSKLVPDAEPNAPPKPPTYVHVVMVNEMMVNIFNTHVDILE